MRLSDIYYGSSIEFSRCRRGFVTAKFQLFKLIFAGRSLYMDLKCGSDIGPRKDAFYRFLNSTSINWLRFTTLLAASVICNFMEMPEFGRPTCCATHGFHQQDFSLP